MPTLCVAAVQMCVDLGAVEANCAAAERLVRAAFARGAQWVILPEFFTSGVAFHEKLLDAARPADGTPYALLRRLAREHGGVVGGSFIALRGGHAYNTFVLAFPDGTTCAHDKDLPTMWENCYYEGGDDDGAFDTPAGRVGVAMCWELVRAGTARRLRDRVDLVVGGSCWWDVPDGAEGAEITTLRAQNLELLRTTPGTFARMLGVPLVHASHAGAFEGFTPGDDQRPYRSRWLGETQIVDARGEILARRTRQEGEGVLVADVHLGPPPAQRPPIPERFWIPDLPAPTLAAWESMNAHGRRYYDEVTLPHRRAGRGASRPTES